MIPIQVWVFFRPLNSDGRTTNAIETSFSVLPSRYISTIHFQNNLISLPMTIQHERTVVYVGFFLLLTWAYLKRFSFQAAKKVFLLNGKLFIKVFDSISCFPCFTLVLNCAAAELSTNVNGLIKTFLRTALFLTAFAECFTWEMKKRKK